MKLLSLFLQFFLSQSFFSETNLQEKRLFQQTPWRLAIWYTVILSLILVICGLGVYKALVYAHQLTVDEELELTAYKIHKNLEPILKEPGKWEITATQLLADICLVERDCLSAYQRQMDPTGTLQKSKYYMLFWSPTGDLIALKGHTPSEFYFTSQENIWQSVMTANGTRYRQFSLKLNTRDFQDWGFIQVGFSLQSFDNYLTNLRWLLLMGFPGVIFLLVMASRYLAKKAMEPIYQSYRQIQQFSSKTKQANEKLEATQVQLIRSNQELEQFAYIVSHDLQEPLRKMKSFSQLLARECQAQFTENEKAQRYLDYIIDAADRQQKLVRALLDYSRLKRQDITKVAVDLNAVVKKVLEDLSVSITETQATVTVGDLPTVNASPTQMGQLFLNLIGNGIKFRGSASPRIQIEAQWQSAEWLISVQDNGIGINPKYAERIFQVFQRLHSRSDYPGTGIGLAICRKIVEGHGGRIWVSLESGQGSTFYFTLPVAPSPGHVSTQTELK